MHHQEHIHIGGDLFGIGLHRGPGEGLFQMLDDPPGFPQRADPGHDRARIALERQCRHQPHGLALGVDEVEDQ